MSVINNHYTISLLGGEKDIWFFLKKNNLVMFEQVGIKSVNEAFKIAKSIIDLEESKIRGPLQKKKHNKKHKKKAAI